MKFEKQVTINGALVPRSALQLADLGEQGNLGMHTLPGAVILTRKRMTAAELAQTVEALAELSSQLIACLADACGTCADCPEEQCPFDSDDYLKLLDELQTPDMPLSRTDTSDNGLSARNIRSLHDISPALLELLADHGVCLSELEAHLSQKDVIYG